MKIQEVETWSLAIDLTQPYTIASRTISAVDLLFVRIRSDTGLLGIGSASPAEEVTGESFEACSEALSAAASDLLPGHQAAQLGALCHQLESDLAGTPAARLAIETALHDLLCRHLGIGLVDYFGRCHNTLPTSITIGIKPSVEEALDEVDRALGQGFTCLKIKIGRDLDADLELLDRLRRHCGPQVSIRVDANRGYTPEQTSRLWPAIDRWDIEIVEQPVPVRDFARLAELPAEHRRKIAADESLLDTRDALGLLQSPRPCGIFNIKLMKCGGLTTARTIAEVARCSGIDLMWGCMDESIVTITAALHVALACPRTRYLDLDGSFDLTSDPATGGFRLIDGRLHLEAGSGLGVDLAPEIG